MSRKQSSSAGRESREPSTSLYEAFTALCLASIDPDNSDANMKKCLFDVGTETAWVSVAVKDGKNKTRGQTIRIFQSPDQEIMLDDGRQAHTIHARGPKCLSEIHAWYRDKVQTLAKEA